MTKRQLQQIKLGKTIQILIIIQLMKNNSQMILNQGIKNQEISQIQLKLEQKEHETQKQQKKQQNSEKKKNESKKIVKKLSNLIQNFDSEYLRGVQLSPQKIKISKQILSSLQKKKVNFSGQQSSQVIGKQRNLQELIKQTQQQTIYEFNSFQKDQLISEQKFSKQFANEQYFIDQLQLPKMNLQTQFGLKSGMKIEQIKQKVKKIKSQIMKTKLKKSNSTGSSSPKSSFSSIQIDSLTNLNNLCQSVILDDDDNRLSIDSFEIISFLGEGIYGRVILAKDKKTNFLVALKQISKLNMSTDTSSYLARQIKIQSFLNHPNIVQLYNFFDDQDYIYLILQICNSGNLYSYMIKQGPLTQKKTREIVRQICQAIDYLHKNDIIHRDLKPQNILLHNNVIKLCDFGWAVQSPLSRGTLCGTPIYASPELVQKKNYDTKIDIWNIGIMTYQFLFGFTPFEIRDEEDLQKVVFNQVLFPPTIEISDICKDFILKCLIKDPKKRINIIQLKDHQFLRSQQKLRVSIKQGFQKINC